MRNWKNWRTRDPLDNSPEALGTDPLLEFPFNGAEPTADSDRAWSCARIAPPVEDYIDPALTGRANNFWKFLKWWRYGQSDIPTAVSAPGYSRHFLVDLGLETKRRIARGEYDTTGVKSGREADAIEGFAEGCVAHALINGQQQVGWSMQSAPGIFVYMHAFPGGIVETRILLQPPVSFDFGAKTVRVLVDGQTYTLPLGVVNGSKVLASTPYTTTFAVLQYTP